MCCFVRVYGTLFRSQTLQPLTSKKPPLRPPVWRWVVETYSGCCFELVCTKKPKQVTYVLLQLMLLLICHHRLRARVDKNKIIRLMMFLVHGFILFFLNLL